MARDPDEPATDDNSRSPEPPAQPGSYQPIIPPASSFPGPAGDEAAPSMEHAWYPQSTGDLGAAGDTTTPARQASEAFPAHSEQPSFQQPPASPEAQAGQPSLPPGYYQPAAPGQAGAAATPAGADQYKPWHDLSLLGQAAGIAGLLLLISFFLPWFFSPAFTARNPLGLTTLPTISHSGWSAASGVPIFDASTSLMLFPHLWLVPLSALALIAVAVLLRMGRLSIRLASVLIVAPAFLALLIEFFFLIQVNSIESAFSLSQAGIIARQVAYGLSWGFWFAVIVTIAALGIGLFLFLQEYGLTRRALPGTQQAPGGPDQQGHPTAW
jgi:hypothetical protein